VSFFDLVIIQPIFNMLMVLYSIIPGGDFGVAVIVFTILVRFAMWPLIVRQLHQVKAMRKMQPELVNIKKQAKGNRQLEGMMMLELYKKHNINPFRSIAILLVQLPIFLGLYYVIQIFVLHRNELGKFAYDAVEKIPAVAHLIANPDSFNQHLFGVIDLTRHAVDGKGVDVFLVLLAIGAGALQYISSKQTMPQQESKKGLRQIMAEAAEGKEANQSEMNAVVMQKMVKIMPFFMIYVMMIIPGAVALYYFVSTLVGVVQQYILLRRDEDEMEEIAEAGEKKLSKRAEQAKEATVVASKKPTKKEKDSDTIIRITAKPSKKKGGKR
jgi:YidC/Oxa1 family membrane protein insertase